MKELFYVLPIAGFLALSACALELNAFDKFILEHVFGITSINESSVSVTDTDYDSAPADNVYTYTYTNALTSGTLVNTTKTQNAPSGGTVSYDQDVTKYNLSGTLNFDENGMYDFNSTQTLVSTQHSDETTTDPEVLYTADPSVNTFEGTWSWANTEDPKSYITIQNLGTFRVVIDTKAGTMTLTQEQHTSNTSSGTDWVGDYTQVYTNDVTKTWVLTAQ